MSAEASGYHPNVHESREIASPKRYEIVTSEKFVADVVHEIGAAKQTVDLQFHAYEADGVGHPIEHALRDASKRGLQVRFIVDHFSDFKHSNHLVQPHFLAVLRRQKRLLAEVRETQRSFVRMEADGVEVKRINPLGFTNLLSRDHKKIIVMDGNTDEGKAYIGGMNLTSHNMSWRDFMVKMTGEAAGIIQEDFDRTMNGTNDHGRILPFDDGKIVTDAIGSAKILPEAIELINGAEKNVLMESPYVWGDDVLNALSNAAWRGLRVSVVFPQHPGEFFVPTEKDKLGLAKKGVNVYIYHGPEPMFHSKTLVADDNVVVGSSNFNGFTDHRMAEICLFTQNKALRSDILLMAASDMANSLVLLPNGQKVDQGFVIDQREFST